mmetsp:Transcript_12042/g.33310  ORF Transcript_12042/g.33310 Transcript_12042/m.33310 type:complete len:265 (-) Transcript_12042:162-956(-)
MSQSASSSELDRPHRTSMEGMIWNAHHTLEMALDPNTVGIPQGYFQNCAGICILSVVEVGFVFSGSVGSGLLLGKSDTGEWSSPVACSLSSASVGLTLGKAQKDFIVFLSEQAAVDTFFSEQSLKLGGKSNLTLGHGREYVGTLDTQGGSPTVCVAFSEGAFVSVALGGALVKPRMDVNKGFYGAGAQDVADILRGKVGFPENRITLMPQLWQQLNQLSKGETREAQSSSSKAEVEEARVAANEAAELVHREQKNHVEELPAST